MLSQNSSAHSSHAEEAADGITKAQPIDARVCGRHLLARRDSDILECTRAVQGYHRLVTILTNLHRDEALTVVVYGQFVDVHRARIHLVIKKKDEESGCSLHYAGRPGCFPR